MEKRLWLAVLYGIAVTLISESAGKFVKTGDCEAAERVCEYNYDATGNMHNKKAVEEIELKSKVTLQCQSVGTFNNAKAKYYCITLQDASVKYSDIKTSDGTKTTKDEFSFKDKDAKAISGNFCFIRDLNGQILKTIYPSTESTEMVNFKKSIVSALQANFAKTPTRKEQDSESTHTSHYSYEKKGSETVEHKKISSNDISSYSGKVDKKSVEHDIEEDITVDDKNIITESKGTSHTSLSKEDPQEEKPIKDDEDIPPIESRTTFSLKKIRCLSSYMLDYYSEDYATVEWESEPVMDGLMARIDNRERDLYEMEKLDDELSDLSYIAKRSVRDTTSHDANHAIMKWRQMLHLESKHGAQGGRKPKLETVLNELHRASMDQSDHSVNLRSMIYNLLSSEGSIPAQQALMRSLRMRQSMDEEYDSIIMAFTLLDSIHHSTLSNYKDYVLANMMHDDQLLLSLATLGRHRNVEHEVVNTIVQLIEDQGIINDTETMIYFIHALGNTGSKLIIPYLTPLILDNANNLDVQLTAIDALRTVSTDKRVQMAFTNLINDDMVPVEIALAISETLRFPYESYLYYPVAPDQAEDEDTEKELLMSLANATIDFHDMTLYNATAKYLKTLRTDYATQLLNEMSMLYSNATKRSLRKRSYTSDWASRAESAYNLVASPSSRASDKKTYPYNKALLWGKQIGPSKIHAKLAVGGFGGVGFTGYKVFAKGKFQLYCFGKTYTAFDAEYLNQYKFVSRQATARQYVKLLGTTYTPRLATAAGVSLPYSKSWSKNFLSLKFFEFRYSMFIYVGTLTFTVKATINLDATLKVGMTTSGATGEVIVRPSITITGGAQAELLLVFRIGLEVSGNMGYYIKPKASVGLCDKSPKADASACFGIFHGSKGLTIRITAYWQRRCSWWSSCSWNSRNKVSALSTSFTLARISEKMLWGKCLACTCNGLLHSFCQSLLAYQASRGTASANGNSCSCSVVNYPSRLMIADY